MIFKMVASNPPSWVKWNYTNNSQFLLNPRREEVSYPAIIEYLRELAKIYFGASKKKKTQLLDDAEKITGEHRKSLIRTLRPGKVIENNKKKKCGARVTYPEELLLPHIKFLWIAMERISPKRMKAAFADWLPPMSGNIAV
ncbi:MAG: hypothetical protein A2451_11625 [Bdellovibrionales bacterium RIFOXYC2_FULL_39_8]|nr:MAG: hypothetical protein A2451_11625 [Bdellovibrionales bacterium RIFOXYC2_FULL_39_8]OFZ77158.1 MAG: hypothetical protein A2560_17915 [Bdellovibrionales bacterium RIFOXYD1_FULL_39_84]